MIPSIREWKKNRERRKRLNKALRLITVSRALPLARRLGEWTVERLLSAYQPSVSWPAVLSFQSRSTRRPWGTTLTIRASLRR